MFFHVSVQTKNIINILVINEEEWSFVANWILTNTTFVDYEKSRMEAPVVLKIHITSTKT